VIRPGDVQRMSAGTGVRHSEFNSSRTEPVHFLQIWIEPAAAGIAPGYEQKTFTGAAKRGHLRLVASPDGADGSVTIHQDARVYATRLGAGEDVEHKLAPGRHAWLQVTRGALTTGGQRLAHGDGAAISGEAVVKLAGGNLLLALFLTVFCVRFDPAAGVLEYANAGHNPPLLRRASGEVSELDADGAAVGILRDVEFELGRAELARGDVLLLYTDGVTEAARADGTQFGEDGLREIFGDLPPQELVDTVFSAARAHAGVGSSQGDDITLVALRADGLE